MVIAANYLHNLPVPELLEVGEDEVGGVLVFAHLYVVLHLGMVDFPSQRVQLRILELLLFLLGLVLCLQLALVLYF